MDVLGAKLERIDDYPLLFEQHPQALWIFDLDTMRLLAANEAAQRAYRYSRAELLELTLFDLAPAEQVPLLRRCFEKVNHNLVTGESRARVFQQKRKDGTLFEVELTWGRVDLGGQAVGMAMAVDVSGSSRGERMVLAQNGLLEMIARGEPLGRILDALVLFAERELPGLLGSVLLLDKEGLHVHHGSGPSLPKVYTDAIDGLAIGPRAGSCGTAAYYGVAVIVHDIRTDPRWDGYREYALPHGLVSCWSTPITSAGGKVLGTFALYYREPRSPTADELGFIDVVTAVARIAIEREQANRVLDETNHALRAIIDNAPGGIVAVDRDGRVRTWNPAAEKIFGYSKDEVVGLPLTLAPEGGPAAQLGEQARDLHYLRKDGSDVWVDRRTATLPDPGDGHGAPAGPNRAEVAMFGDVTERHQAGEALRRSAQVQAAILDALPAAIALVDARGVILSVNGTWQHHDGVPLRGAGAAVGENFLERCDDAAAAAGIRAVLAGTLVHYDQEMPSDGASGAGLSWHRLVVRPVGAVELEGALIAIIDVTARKQAEDRVRESQARYRQIFENDVTGDLVSRPDGTILDANPAFARSFGFSAAETVGRSELMLFPDPATRAALVERLHGERSVPSVELELRRKDGKPVHVRANVVGTFDAAGRLERVSWFFLDRSEEKQLEEQLRQAQKMEAVGLLAGGVAHDFNNLLTVINSYSDLLLGRMGSGGPLTEMVSEIRAAGDRASQLTRQLLAFGRKQVLTPVSLDLHDLLASVSGMLRRLIAEDIAISTRLEAAAPTIYADRGQIEQVALNLALNARDAMPDGGRLLIATRDVEVDAAKAAQHPGVTPGHYVAMIVEDTGHGMDEATAQRVFEPFFTTKGAGKGTGLGLAMVYGIVRQSGGFVEVESAPGAGAIFTVYLPQDRGLGSRRARAPRQVPLAHRAGETVLLVEDEASIRTLCRQVLVEQGYRVLEAQDGREALERAEAHEGPIDILITDVVMPHLSGRALADRMQTNRPGIKVLYVSGYTDDAIVRHGVSENAVAFLAKPFTPETLLGRVREVLDRG
jgi:two-component system cell cycle sensor histidine kinase/response regulator CckA